MLLSLLAALAVGAAPDDGEALLRRINEAHRDTWFTTLTFVQHTTFPGTGRPDETWYETMDRPGKLRLDIEREGRMVGRVIFRADSIYQFAEGRPPVARPLVHSLLLLLHDIHVGSADDVIAKLKAQGFDLSTTGTATWEGAPVVVVGAVTGDTIARQFWVDPERLVVVRVMQPGQGGVMSDIQVGGFTSEGPALVERKVVFLTGGTATTVEEYRWLTTGVKLPDSVFDPGNAALPAWVAAYRTPHGAP
ncbi:MAG: hypothetical protein U0974_04260 [Gemmatimonadales bacterium]|nr:hypothetical protein [Gemmatimonadales bacterium]MDZ4388922.1 hypothetical protein [Gemmatimonadales bacterium]